MYQIGDFVIVKAYNEFPERFGYVREVYPNGCYELIGGNIFSVGYIVHESMIKEDKA